MKKTEIILAISAGLGVAFVFQGIIKGFEIDNILGIEIKVLTQSLFLILPLGAISALWVSYLIGKKLLFVPQVTKFLMLGILATLIDIYVFKGSELVSGLDTKLSRTIFKGISFIAATFGKYLGNKYLVFEKGEMESTGKEMVQFFLVNFTSLGMNVAVFYLLVNVLGPQFGIQLSVWKTISVIISGTAICAWNFLGYKFIVFKK